MSIYHEYPYAPNGISKNTSNNDNSSLIFIESNNNLYNRFLSQSKQLINDTNNPGISHFTFFNGNFIENNFTSYIFL